MASVIDYMLQTDEQLAKNRAENLKNKLLPMQTIISAQNSSSRMDQVDNAAKRWSSLTYVLRTLPPAARSFVLQNPQIADKMSQMMTQGDQPGALKFLNQEMNNGGQSPEYQNVSNMIQQGANQDYQKATHTNQDINQVQSGKNAESTLKAIMDIAPSIAKFSTFKGKAKSILDSIGSGLGIDVGKDYENYNNFKNTLLGQMSSQLRQFYGSSIQPSEMDKKEAQLSPQPGENEEQYLNRLSQMANVLSAELAQRQQTYTDTFNKAPLTPDAPDSSSIINNGNKKDFGQMLYDNISKGARR